MFGPLLHRNRIKHVIEEYKNTLLNIIENELKDDQILFDEYIKDSSRIWLLPMPKLISHYRWIEQLRQRINNQIEPLKTIDIKYEIINEAFPHMIILVLKTMIFINESFNETNKFK